MLLSAEFWAQVRRLGVPTADPKALDVDCILAAQARLAGQPGDRVRLATTNVRHLHRFPNVTALHWMAIR